MKHLYKKLVALFSGPAPAEYAGKASYSQCGEDVIMEHLLVHVLGVPQPRFVDIGSGDPRKLNNTYRFYQQGCRGVCVEPNPRHAAAIRIARPDDVCLEAGVVPSDDQPRLAFYLFEPPTLSTFSPEERDRLKQNASYRFLGEREVPVLTLNQLFATHGTPDILSLDLEGIDDAVLRQTDWKKYQPLVVCAETVDHWDEHKHTDLIAWMEAQGYTVYADTFINTIFVANEPWNRRRRACDV